MKKLIFLMAIMFAGITFAEVVYTPSRNTITGNATISGSLTSASTVTISGNLFLGDSTHKSTFTAASGNLDLAGAIAGTTINTGQGANEVYAMNQNLRTTDTPLFSSSTISYGISAGSVTVRTGTISVSTGSVSLPMTFGGVYDSLPISGFSKWTIIGVEADGKLYKSTEAVSSALSWVEF
jgi:hypothetical protein